MNKLIENIKLNYNIGINCGDNLTNIICEKGEILPCTKDISFKIPEIEEEYEIDIIIGNNILAEDNILINKIRQKYNDKVIYIKIEIMINYLVLSISSKLKLLYIDTLIYNDQQYIPNNDKIIDTTFYKLKFDINQIIKLIKKRIILGYISLDEESKIILEQKLNKIIENINNYTNQKLLEIKNSLQTKFFIN